MQNGAVDPDAQALRMAPNPGGLGQEGFILRIFIGERAWLFRMQIIFCKT
jgi:hypothetical protein